MLDESSNIQNISIHALREEGDVDTLEAAVWCFLFLSTPSARRATTFSSFHFHIQVNFYPRPPRGGRQVCIDRLMGHKSFLSTPSARRATEWCSVNSYKGWLFLSTPSARRATPAHCG